VGLLSSRTRRPREVRIRERAHTDRASYPAARAPIPPTPMSRSPAPSVTAPLYKRTAFRVSGQSPRGAVVGELRRSPYCLWPIVSSSSVSCVQACYRRASRSPGPKLPDCWPPTHGGSGGKRTPIHGHRSIVVPTHASSVASVSRRATIGSPGRLVCPRSTRRATSRTRQAIRTRFTTMPWPIPEGVDDTGRRGPQRRRASFEPECAAHVAGEGSGDLPSDPSSSSSPSTPLRSTAFTATMMEKTDIYRAENSGLSMTP